jgi:hypothetical protein
MKEWFAWETTVGSDRQNNSLRHRREGFFLFARGGLP